MFVFPWARQIRLQNIGSKPYNFILWTLQPTELAYLQRNIEGLAKRDPDFCKCTGITFPANGAAKPM